MLLLLLLLLVAFSAEAQDTKDFYIGAGACSRCHAVEYSNWSETTHSHAYESLIEREAEEDPTCYECHTVGYGKPGGFVSPASTPDLSAVQCESCHGPGGRHARDGAQYASPTLLGCGSCHTPDIDPEFDAQEAWDRVRH